MPNTTIEQKLRNLQINLAQGRTQEELAQAGIFFPPSTTSKSNETSIPPGQANAFSNYIDSVHRALDSSKPAASISSIPESKVDPPSYYSSSPYHHDYVHHDYQRVVAPSFQVNFSPPISTFPSRSTFVRLPPPDDDQWANRRDSFPSHEELKSPSTTDSVGVSSSTEKSPLTEADMKTEFVNFRKKQFETGHVENIVRDPQRESKTKKYSEKKKYENEWNRLTAVADVESVMDRASHFEDIDRDKFARLKSKLPTSPPIPEHLNPEDAFNYEFNPNPNHFYDHPIKLLKTSLDSARGSTDRSKMSKHLGRFSSFQWEK